VTVAGLPGDRRPFARRVVERAWRASGGIPRTRSLILFHFDLTLLPDGPGSAAVRLVSAADVRARAPYKDGWYSRDRALERLAKGYRLFALCDEREDVCFGWVERHTAEMQWLGLQLHLPQDVAYLSGLYTSPQKRGQGLGMRMVLERLRHCSREQCTHVLVAIDPANTASLEMHKRLGFHAYERVDYYRAFYVKGYRITSIPAGKSRHRVSVAGGPQDLWKAFWPAPGDIADTEPGHARVTAGRS